MRVAIGKAAIIMARALGQIAPVVLVRLLCLYSDRNLEVQIADYSVTVSQSVFMLRNGFDATLWSSA